MAIISAIAKYYPQVFYFSLELWLLFVTKEGVVMPERIACPYNDNDDDNKMFIIENSDWNCITGSNTTWWVTLWGTIQSAFDAEIPPLNISIQ